METGGMQVKIVVPMRIFKFTVAKIPNFHFLSTSPTASTVYRISGIILVTLFHFNSTAHYSPESTIVSIISDNRCQSKSRTLKLDLLSENHTYTSSFGKNSFTVSILKWEISQLFLETLYFLLALIFQFKMLNSEVFYTQVLLQGKTNAIYTSMIWICTIALEPSFKAIVLEFQRNIQ